MITIEDIKRSNEYGQQHEIALFKSICNYLSQNKDSQLYSEKKEALLAVLDKPINELKNIYPDLQDDKWLLVVRRTLRDKISKLN